jgi:hypothetical protein
MYKAQGLGGDIGDPVGGEQGLLGGSGSGVVAKSAGI